MPSFLRLYVAHLMARFVAFLVFWPIELEAWIRITLVASTIIAAMELHKYLRRDLSLLPPTR